jgi:uncharacterized protein YndB with AHSA1/START domain
MDTNTRNRTGTMESKTALNNEEIVIDRVFAIPVAKVWRAWTDPESMKKWWGPNGFTCPTSTIDARQGGKYLNCMRSSDGQDFWSTGFFKEFVPNKKLVLTDSFSDSKGNIISASELNMPGKWPLEMMIAVNFEEDNGQTKMRLRHKGIPSEMHDDCIKGWNESFDKLENNIR